jgi:hypothetical protein
MFLDEASCLLGMHGRLCRPAELTIDQREHGQGKDPDDRKRRSGPGGFLQRTDG